MSQRVDTYQRAAYAMQFEPIMLKEIAQESSISQSEITQQVSAILGHEVSRATINLCVNRGYIPPTVDGFQTAVEKVISGNPKAMGYLLSRGLPLGAIWNPLGRELRNSRPTDQGERTVRGKFGRQPATKPGNPDLIEMKEVEMINPEALKHFKLFRNPFLNDVNTADDIYMSEEHRYLEAVMLDAARFNGMLAIVGQVGSGKSTIRKKIIEQLRKSGDIHVVFPQILDKDRINSGTLCDAIIMDISDQKPKVKHEQKARQVRQLLLDRCKEGSTCCLIVEEAHNLTVHAFKTIKQLHELEDGYRKLLGVIFIGQTELGDKLNEQYHPEMREVIRRTQIARINGLDKNLTNYLEKKIKRVGGKLENIIDEKGIATLSRRLTGADSQGKAVSNAYPLSVNIYMSRAMNLAFEMGEHMVTADIMEAI